ncbi:MAG: DNA mismatch repair protein MutS [Candidatus Desulfofervidaceae bacterium]|nr:DNA mismatch repair protein MutS [Candidatus Desulfofervidaceae bacterium]
MSSTQKQLTPAMRQYLEIKQQYPDAILFFRMGDFYEMFFEDAKIASQVLEIALTSRQKDTPQPIPMCGIPYHALNSYLPKLIKRGYKVAICEQVEDPKQAKGIVRREVVQVITPGMILEPEFLETNKSNYLAAATAWGERYGLASLEISTADFKTTEVRDLEELKEELHRLEPSELLVPEALSLQLDLNQTLLAIKPETEMPDLERAQTKLKKHFSLPSLKPLGLEDLPAATIAAAWLLEYAEEAQKNVLSHITRLQVYNLSEFMVLDSITLSHLEVFRRWHGGKEGTLWSILDKTLTPMGGRLLREMLLRPLKDIKAIKKRLNYVETFVRAGLVRQAIREKLKQIGDLERLNSRVVLGKAHARDLVNLKNSLNLVPEVKALLTSSQLSLLQEVGQGLDTMEDVTVLIDRAIVDDPPLTLKEGGLIKQGYNEILDNLIKQTTEAKTWIANLEAKERRRTGIPNLKVGYNKVFGYYIEVSKAQLKRVPSDYIRKQTLVNAERFITPALKEYENVILGAEEKRNALEYELFLEIRQQIAQASERLLRLAANIAWIDVMTSLAEVAVQYNYVRPKVVKTDKIIIKDGRHPVIEQTVKDVPFVPNDIRLNEEERILIITGPNMAGKSTIIRQAALIVLMAQIGSFVPAKEAQIGVVDRIFTRVGASDALPEGRSTFMVEMEETAHILHQVTPRSLVILDEIGRGTSTFDGMSIAWAVVEYLHDTYGKGVKTLFATHYHELTDLSQIKPRVRNYSIAVREWQGEIVFLHKLLPGGASRSYGIEVARLAGLPKDVISRAKEILSELESKEQERVSDEKAIQGQYQLPLFEPEYRKVIKQLQGIDINRITPLQALNILHKLKNMLKV